MRNSSTNYTRNPHYGKISEVVIYDGDNVIQRVPYDRFVDEVRQSKRAGTIHFAANGHKPLCNAASDHPALTRAIDSVTCKRCLRSLVF